MAKWHYESLVILTCDKARCTRAFVLSKGTPIRKLAKQHGWYRGRLGGRPGITPIIDLCPHDSKQAHRVVHI